MSEGFFHVPVSIERCTLVVWAIPVERVAARLPASLRPALYSPPGAGPGMALLSLLAGRVRLSPFGLALPAVTQLSYQIYVRRGAEQGMYLLKSVMGSRSLAMTSRGAFGFPAQGARLAVRWEPSGRAEIKAPEASLSFHRERAPFGEPFLGAVQQLLCPRAAYWSKRADEVGELSLVTVVSPTPLSGTIATAQLPWLQEEGLLLPEEATAPLVVYFASPHQLSASLAPKERESRRLVVVPSS